MYTVAINLKPSAYAMTSRDLTKSPHWKQLGSFIFDSNNPDKLFFVLNTLPKREALEFKATVSSAYKAQGFTKEFVKE